MDAMEAENLLKKLDRRMQDVEQILPTLPTREEMRAEIREAVRPLATNEELQATASKLVTNEKLDAVVATLATKQELAAAIAPLATKAELAAAIAPLATKAELAAAIAPLATKAELATAIAPLATRAEMREEGEQTRQHFDVVAESLRDDIRLIAESQVTLQAEVRQGRKDLDGILKNHEKRITRLEASDARKRTRKGR